MGMRPTFMGFETAKRGMQINQKALDIVSHNLANIGVTGYTRQRVDQVSISTHGMSSRYDTTNHLMAGQGADIKGVSQVRDPYLDKRFRQEYSDVGYYGKSTEILKDIESALDEYSSDGLKNALAKLSNALSTLHSQTNTTNANIVRTTAKSLTQVLKQFDVKLNNIMDQQKFDLEINVNKVNSTLEKIAALNETIQRDVFAATGTNNAYFAPNELLDERNVLLDELSQYGDIEVKVNADNTVDVSMGGHQVVKGSKSETLSFVDNAEKLAGSRIDNTVSVTWQSSGKDVDFTTGAIAASVNMINGRGPNASGNENFERGVPYYMEQVNTFAKTFADAYNKSIPELVTDKADANYGKPKTDADGNVIYKQLFSFEADKPVGAGSINISDNWNSDPSYIILENSVDGTYDNTYYQEMMDKLTENFKFGEYEGTFEGYVKHYSTTLGEDINFNGGRLSASQSISDNLLDSIAQVSGVSMDEEGAEMLAYQKAYNAMGRVMNVLDEALDKLINETGLVGR